MVLEPRKDGVRSLPDARTGYNIKCLLWYRLRLLQEGDGVLRNCFRFLHVVRQEVLRSNRTYCRDGRAVLFERSCR